MAEFVQLEKSDVHIFPVALDANAARGHNLYPDLDKEQRKDIVGKAIGNDIALADTAFIYGPKCSEELVGEVIKEYPHEKAQIATKDSHAIKDNGDVIQNNQPGYLKQQVKESLEHLQVDYIDLYYIHFPDEYTPKDETMAALQELRKKGKIKAIGVSNFALDQLKKANKDGYVDVVQLEYSLLHRENEEVMKHAAEDGITFVPYFPLASGILAGKYEENQAFNDHRAARRNFQPKVFNDSIRQVEELSSITKTHNTSTTNIVLAFYLTRPSLDVVIPGAKRADQIIENIEAANIELAEEEIKKIDTLFPIE